MAQVVPITSTRPRPNTSLIERAQRELAECYGCKGYPCQKSAPDYFKPVINGNEVTVVRCEHYIAPKNQADEIQSVNAADTSTRFNVFIRGVIVEREKELGEKYKRLKPIFEKKYGLRNLTNAQISQIDAAEHWLKECQDCNLEYCQKAIKPFLQPVIGKDADGNLKIEWTGCPVWNDFGYEEKSWRNAIPEKYLGKTFADYQTTRDNIRAIELAHWFLKEKRDKGLFLYGAPGTGKTFLASIIAQEYVRAFRSVVFGDVPSLLDRIKRTFDGKGNLESVYKKFAKCDLLVLDDIGAGHMTPWSVGQIYQILNERYNTDKLVIATSNLDLDGLANFLGKYDSFGGKRIASRLSEMCLQGFLGVSDRRKLS